MINRAYRWLFENRQTGDITIAQAPNWSLSLFLVAKVIEIVAPTGTIEDIAGWTATGLLLVWAGDELGRGVNPWRRLLGAVVIGWQVVRLVAA